MRILIPSSNPLVTKKSGTKFGYFKTRISKSAKMATDSEVQQLILTELDLSSDETAQANIALWWSLSDSSAVQFLRYLSTKRRVVSYLLGQCRKAIDVTLGTDRFSSNQQFKNLLQLMKDITDEIKVVDPGSGISYLTSARSVNESAGVLDRYSEEYWERNWFSFYRRKDSYWKEPI